MPESVTLSAAAEERSGIDDTLRWRLYRSNANTLEQLIEAVDLLPDDGLLLIEHLPGDRVQMQYTGLQAWHSALDMAWIVAGPNQQERARAHRAAHYQVIGTPA